MSRIKNFEDTVELYFGGSYVPESVAIARDRIRSGGSYRYLLIQSDVSGNSDCFFVVFTSVSGLLDYASRELGDGWYPKEVIDLVTDQNLEFECIYQVKLKEAAA